MDFFGPQKVPLGPNFYQASTPNQVVRQKVDLGQKRCFGEGGEDIIVYIRSMYIVKNQNCVHQK